MVILYKYFCSIIKNYLWRHVMVLSTHISQGRLNVQWCCRISEWFVHEYLRKYVTQMPFFVCKWYRDVPYSIKRENQSRNRQNTTSVLGHINRSNPNWFPLQTQKGDLTYLAFILMKIILLSLIYILMKGRIRYFIMISL